MANVPFVVQAGRKQYRRLSDDQAVDLYFDLYDKIKKALTRKDFRTLMQCCVASLPLVERYVRWFKKSAPGNPVQVPSIYYACRFFPITGAKGQLQNILELVEFLPAIHDYRDCVHLAISSIEIVRSIRSHLTDNPGTKQNKLKKALGYEDGRYLSQLVKDMESLGQLERRKSGNTYELFVLDTHSSTLLSAPSETGNQRPTKRKSFFSRLNSRRTSPE